MASSVSQSHLSSYTNTTWTQSHMEGAGAVTNETFKDRMLQTQRWIYNCDEGTVMGRTPRDWGFLLVSHLVLWAAVLFTSTAFCGMFYKAVDWNYPTYHGPDTILQTPGLSIRPQQDAMSTLIRYVKTDPATYTKHVDHIEAYIQYYENNLQQGDSFMDCSSVPGRRSDDQLDKACVFDISKELGDDCVKQLAYGFFDAQPCILLKLNKVYNWLPEEYTEDTVPTEIEDMWTEPMSVYVKCYGRDNYTQENMGDLIYFPENGFHFKYFPFRNQQGYRSPLMFVRFDNPSRGTLLMMRCKAFAKNIAHDRIQRIGQVDFELMID